MITLIMRSKKKDSKVTLRDFEPELIRKVVTPLETQKGSQVFRKVMSLHLDMLGLLLRRGFI